MIRKSLFLIVILLTSYAFPAQSQYKIDRKTIGYGGVNSQNNSYKIRGTVGQPAIGTSQANNRVKTGFWYTIIEIPMPQLSTNSVTVTGFYTALSGGEITSEGSSSITARGVVWSSSANPTLESHSSGTFTLDGSGIGSFSSTVSGLNPGASYHLRAYATNSEGTYYGNEVVFSTIGQSNVPTLGEWGVIVLISILACYGSWWVYRQHA
ncbi:MAG: hypothetical protein HW421_906 [Ignavibacteria bacterium]|nr:hypothetical protein [Ignavibacteria bacterium]